MTGPAGRRPGRSRPWQGLVDRIRASRHRRSIVGSLAVLALLIVVLVSGLFGGGGGSAPSPSPSPSVSAGAS